MHSDRFVINLMLKMINMYVKIICDYCVFARELLLKITFR